MGIGAGEERRRQLPGGSSSGPTVSSLRTAPVSGENVKREIGRVTDAREEPEM